MRPLQWMRAVRDSDLPGELRATAWAIGLRADRFGACWPSFQQIAEDCGHHRRTAIRHVAALTDKGWLMPVRRSNGHGHQSNSYQLIIPHGLWKSQGASDTGVTTLVTPVSPPSDTGVTPQVVTPVSLRSVKPNEVQVEVANAPVDNPHLSAVISLMSNQHRIPR